MKDPIAAIPRAGPARPLPGHLVAVKAGDHGSRFTGNIDQDGGCGAPIHGAVINAGQHDDGRFGGGLEGGGKEQGHGTHGPYPRQYTDQGSDEYPDETIKQILRLEGDRETDSQVIKEVHVKSTPQYSRRELALQPELEHAIGDQRAHNSPQDGPRPLLRFDRLE